jgi:hypothetical protein
MEVDLSSLLATVRMLTTGFRTAIEGCDRHLLPISFRHFPRGSCRDASLLLGTYLSERGCGSFDYVAGERGDWQSEPPTWVSHAWAAQGDLIADITADQYPDAPAGVIVTTDSPWHQSFRRRVGHAANYRLFDERTVKMLEAANRRLAAAADRLP